MKAYLLYEAGGTDKLVLDEAQRPTLKSGEVLIKVKAIGINPADTIYRKTPAFITAIFGEERPVIMGWDISGEVVEKSDNTDGFEIGDAVFALLQNARGYAEFVAVNAALLAHKPKNITFEEAAASPMAGLTAFQPLVNGMNIKKGDKILIHGAAGGVGHYAVQIAKSLGAKVIATSSAKNHDFIMSLGVDKHIDYKTENFWEVIKDVDFVFDTIGGETLEHSIDLTKSGGTIISIIPMSDQNLKSKAQEKNIKLSLWGLQFNGEDMRAFADLMYKGAIKSHIAKTYPFSSMAEAHTQVETRHTAGKIVITV
ncbi:similar to alcohol dehydrogenase [Chryseobacterium sp. StRB126]|uniref:NADP-dependent oxidoreductase n=1 Tax=Chryseobacterium sp. StRB126 TaxID=878220 RepID=UPI0004E98C70|nr:NADP-dependent oxidoreductase [Chryseobacterium sp. StRB126]BAP31939.1 similar to alcohol dehydrogenase [Chryseobacterium sp. StRB126]